MKHFLPPIDPKKETVKITSFIQQILKRTGKQHVVIGLSGGIDSTISLFLLAKTIDVKHIHVAHLSYFDSVSKVEKIANNLKIPPKNIHHLSIKSAVDKAAKSLNLYSSSERSESRSPILSSRAKRGDLSSKIALSSETPRNDAIRFGNIMARTRMIYLYDLAKKYDALVCGTENKSEHLLGYFTRYGDEASDFEPIKHLYKTQVYQLAEYLDVPAEIINQTPTAGLWHNQTDEKQFGFSYEEADQVLYLYFDKKSRGARSGSARQTIENIEKLGFKNAEKIITWAKNNHFKHEVPYVIS